MMRSSPTRQPRESFRAVAIEAGPGPLQIDLLTNARNKLGPFDLAVLPELATTPYFPLERSAHWRRKAATHSSRIFGTLRNLASAWRCYILVPLYLNVEGGYYNAACLVGPSGDLVSGRDLAGNQMTEYRKIHLCDIRLEESRFYESFYFSAGESLILWDTSIGCISSLICYDRHFSEAWLALRLAGAETVCVSTSSPSSTFRTFIPEMQAMALQNSVHVVVASRRGTEVLETSRTQTEFVGQSCIIGADGRVLDQASDERPYALADLQATVRARARSELSVIENRRPEVYNASSEVAPTTQRTGDDLGKPR